MTEEKIMIFISYALLCNGIRLGIIETDQSLVRVCKMALKDAQNAKECISDTIQILNAAMCMMDSPARGTANAVNFHFQQNVESEVLEIAGLARSWNSPVVTRTVVTNPSISDQNLYPTVVQFGLTSALDFTYAIKCLSDYLNITSMLLVSSNERNFDHYSIISGIKQVVEQQNSFHIEEHIEIDGHMLRTNKVTGMSLRTNASNPEMVFYTLEITSLTNDQYMVILICDQISEICTSAVRHIVKKAKIIVLAPVIEKYKEIGDTLSKRMNFTIKQEEVETYMTMYDACYGFCFGIGNGAAIDGKKFAQFMKNQQFTGCDIFLCFYYLEEIVNYAFQWLNSEKDEFETVMKLSMVQAPLPVVGLIVISSTVALVLGSIGFYLYRRKKHVAKYRMMWKIPKENLKVIESKRSKGHAVSDNLSNKRRHLDSYALVGTLKAEFICFKQYKRIPWSKVQLKFLYELKSLNHNNLTNFIGICYNDLDRFYVLHALIERASLEDFIYDRNFNVDDTFKSAFIKDILKGLQYLHKSSIGYHGMLSLKTCMIDANWVLKLTNFGISSLLNELINQNYIRTAELIPQQFYVTVAPELLAGIQIGFNFPKGSVVGDVYSFGMMLYSIIYRIRPFDRLSLKEVLNNVIHKSLRPQIDSDNDDPLITLMRQCWDPTPEARPKLRNIHQTIGTIFSSSEGNLVDQMIKINENYAQNLERIVAERTSLLVEAQGQTDRLLCEMLPPSIAAQLKAGKPVIPRNYESVTVGFCQIVEFMHLMEQCTPGQVIAFLNEAFMTFDEIIRRHDAYKVETTGETYMVASGVPSENGGQHIFEIAEIALEIREKTLAYKVVAAPNWHLRVRIGFHCGPIAAGVIGLRSPRYCLFGDTVNFASRMQSNCVANQIQVAESTAKILMQRSKYRLKKRGVVQVKGKGNVNTYWLNELVLNVQQQAKETVPEL
uniref:guanylate cyclase n=1 Tax=Setaria digitata TaxID=48799 RepID=A0A915PGV2_9BILA